MNLTTKHNYVGLWQGGQSYGQGSWSEDALAIIDIEHAQLVVDQRFLNKRTPELRRAYQRTPESTTHVGRFVEQLDTPAVDETSHMLLVAFEGADLHALDGECFPDEVITPSARLIYDFVPGMDVVIENLSSSRPRVEGELMYDSGRVGQYGVWTVRLKDGMGSTFRDEGRLQRP